MENFGRYYEETLPDRAINDVHIERQLDPPREVFYYPIYYQRLLKKHPEKKGQWEFDLELLKARVRARLDKNLSSVEMQRTPELTQ
jgi:hypothetical protein